MGQLRVRSGVEIERCLDFGQIASTFSLVLLSFVSGFPPKWEAWANCGWNNSALCGLGSPVPPAPSKETAPPYKSSCHNEGFAGYEFH